MFDYIRFFIRYAKPLSFGAGMTFFSSFGQTFMVSQFVPFLHEELRLSNAAFGSVYSGATLVSAALLVKAGRRVDTEALDAYTLKAAFILCAAALLLAATVHPLMLFAALFGLRFAGQGLTSHIGQTVMARHFQKSRGKALSLASLGYSAGEIVLPVVLAFSVPALGWRASLAALALAATAAAAALVRLLPVRTYERVAEEDRLGVSGGAAAPAERFRAFGDPAFRRLVAPGWLFTFASTGYFFYQMMLVREKGWDAKWYALAFGAYAVVRVAATFGVGALVDRFGARRLYRLHFLPFVSGCLVMGLSGGASALVFFLVAMGATMGASSVLQSAVLAETYGAAVVGAVRSVFAAVMIFGAAAGPAAFGLSLDAGIPMEGILLGIGTLAAVSALPLFFPKPAAG